MITNNEIKEISEEPIKLSITVNSYSEDWDPEKRIIFKADVTLVPTNELMQVQSLKDELPIARRSFDMSVKVDTVRFGSKALLDQAFSKQFKLDARTLSIDNFSFEGIIPDTSDHEYTEHAGLIIESELMPSAYAYAFGQILVSEYAYLLYLEHCIEKLLALHAQSLIKT